MATTILWRQGSTIGLVAILTILTPSLLIAERTEHSVHAKLEQSIDALQERIELLEERDAPVHARPGQAPVMLNGILRTWWRNQSDTPDSFGLRNARFVLRGEVSSDVRWLMQLEGATNTSRMTDAPTVIDGRVSFSLDRGSWDTFVHVGRFVPLISRYQGLPIDTMDFVHFPRFLTGEGNVAVWRQSGLEFHRTAGTLRTIVGIFNGSDPNDGGWVGSSDEGKDWYLRLDTGRFGQRWWGAAWRWWGQAGTERQKRTRQGAFVEHSVPGLRTMVEFASSRDDLGTDLVERRGMLAQTIHRPPQGSVAWSLRWENWDHDRTLANSTERWLTLGSTWFIAERNAFLTVNWVTKRRDEQAIPSANERELVGQITITF